MSGIPYGKYRGLSATTLRDRDPGYCDWLLSLVARGDDGPMARWAATYEDDLRPPPPPAASEFGLTPSQQDAVDVLIDQVSQGRRVIRLQGGAGYGKSFTVAALAAELQRDHGMTPRACAVSYVATENLRKDLDQYGWSTATVARTIGLTKEIDHDTGKDLYVYDEVRTPELLQKVLSRNNALIVDECSMINDETAGWLFDAVNLHGGLLVLVGDERQLPPVKQEVISRCCFTPDPASLTVPMRYSADSDLFRVEQTARNTPHHLGQVLAQLCRQGSEQVISTGNRAALIERYVANYRADPTAEHRALFFRREDVVTANNRIRNALFGLDAAEIEPGEQLMILATADTPWASEEDKKAAFARGETLSERFYSGERFLVEDATPDVHMGIPCWMVRFAGRDPARVIFGLSEVRADVSKRGGSEYEAAMRAAAQYGRDNPGDRDRWLDLQRLKGEFLQVAYCYASTVHRAQGQTVDYAYTVPGALAAIPGLMGRALSYVASTRARKQLVVC